MSVFIRAAITTVLVAVLSALFFMPALNWQSGSFLTLVAFCAVLSSMVPLGSKEMTLRPSYDGPRLDVSNNAAARIVSTAICAVAALVVLAFLSSTLVRTGTYYKLLGEEATGHFAAGLPPLDIQKAPLVSEEMARRAAEKRLAEIPALGSLVSIGTLEKQLVRGELVWVAFLEHRGFFKWNSEGTTPGYVMVSAHDPSDVKLVTEVGGKKLALRYISSSFFADEAERHTWFNGFSRDILGDFVPEIDDEGNPFLVAPIFEKKALLGGRDVVAAVVLNPQTGDLKRYSLADVPAWIDRIQPADVIKAQLTNRLHLVDGWLNPSDKGRLEISGDLDVVYGADGRAYYFAGHTSLANKAGMVSFSLIDSRTKKATRYMLSGITESTAQQTAQGVNPEKHYQATNALPFMLEGHAVLVMALTDGTGIVRGYGIVSIDPAQTVAVADTLAATSRLFLSKTTVDRTRLETGSHAEPLPEEITTVVRKSSEVRGGNTTYTLVLTGHPGVLFSAGPDLSEDLAVTAEGDKVSVRFAKASGRVIGLQAFRNLTLDTVSPAPAAQPAPRSGAVSTT